MASFQDPRKKEEYFCSNFKKSCHWSFTFWAC